MLDFYDPSLWCSIVAVHVGAHLSPQGEAFCQCVRFLVSKLYQAATKQGRW